MKGKVKNANSSYNTTVEPIDTVMPIVVLVNEATASASEITSGTLQDYDRAVIMGTRTYGKGLVQIPNVSLPYNGKLKLTTAKYYIPSGRCIQALRYKHTDNGYVAENVPDSLTHEFRTHRARRRWHQARHRSEARLAAQHRLLSLARGHDRHHAQLRD